jgi:hypothetical protein
MDLTQPLAPVPLGQQHRFSALRDHQEGYRPTRTDPIIFAAAL